VIVVSPHFDDAILSLGSAIAYAAHLGAKVEVLTVFADIPSSDASANLWDRECGFSTEGQAASASRDEDRQACLIVDAEPRWLNFGCEYYDRRGSEDAIWSAVTSTIGGADSVIVPGFPLVHADHICLSKPLLHKGLKGQRVALYVEQPYAFYLKKAGRSLAVTPSLTPIIRGSFAWTRIRTARAHRCAKLQVVRWMLSVSVSSSWVGEYKTSQNALARSHAGRCSNRVVVTICAFHGVGLETGVRWVVRRDHRKR
jgi:hypothetical protein